MYLPIEFLYSHLSQSVSDNQTCRHVVHTIRLTQKWYFMFLASNYSVKGVYFNLCNFTCVWIFNDSSGIRIFNGRSDFKITFRSSQDKSKCTWEWSLTLALAQLVSRHSFQGCVKKTHPTFSPESKTSPLTRLRRFESKGILELKKLCTKQS